MSEARIIVRDIPGPAFVLTSHLLPGYRFEGWSVDQPPADSTAAIMFRRSPAGYFKCGGGLFKDGKWTNAKGRPLDVKDLYWTKIICEGTEAES